MENREEKKITKNENFLLFIIIFVSILAFNLIMRRDLTRKERKKKAKKRKKRKI